MRVMKLGRPFRALGVARVSGSQGVALGCDSLHLWCAAWWHTHDQGIFTRVPTGTLSGFSVALISFFVPSGKAW